jgi:hypothetical protein
MECAVAEDVTVDFETEFQWEFCKKKTFFLGRCALHFIVSTEKLFVEAV